MNYNNKNVEVFIMNCVLPINENPLVRVYPAYCFAETVFLNESTSSNHIAQISIIDYQKNKWETLLKGESSSISIDNDTIDFYAELYENDAEACFFRPCNKIDEIIVKITHQWFIAAWENIYIFIYPIKNGKTIKGSLYEYTMGRFHSEGLFTCQPNENKNYIDSCHKTILPVWMKIQKNKMIISYWLSFDGSSWEKLTQCTITDDNCEGYFIGVKIPYIGNQHYKWLFSNFIQLYGGTTKNIPVPVTYCANPSIFYDMYAMNPFVNILIEKTEMLSVYGLTLWEYIIKNINANRYLEVTVDELFLHNSSANISGYHLIHKNLVYGYNEKEKKLFLIHYYYGKPKLITVSYNDLNKAYEMCDYGYIILYEYCKNRVTYKLNIEHMCYMLHSYLQGEGKKDIGMWVFNEPLDIVYGIKLYDDYIKDENSINIFINDVRIAYVFHEHKIIMKERLKYLINARIINNDESKRIIENNNKLVSISEIIINLILKNRFKPDLKIKNEIKDIIIEMKNLELETYTELHNLLWIKLFTVTFSTSNDGGYITATVNANQIYNNSKILKNKTIIFTAILKKDYYIESWCINGIYVNDYTEKIYIHENIQENIDIIVKVKNIVE
jgi:hypothetical protein